MNVDELAAAIKRRALLAGVKDAATLATPIAKFVRSYGAKVGMEAFAGEYFALPDLQGRKLGFYQAETKAGVLWCHTLPHSDVLILMSGEMILGWVGLDQIVVSATEFTAEAQQLRELPKVFDFSLPCPHLSVYGGWGLPDMSSWECFGCGELIAQVAQ